MPMPIEKTVAKIIENKDIFVSQPVSKDKRKDMPIPCNAPGLSKDKKMRTIPSSPQL